MMMKFALKFNILLFSVAVHLTSVAQNITFENDIINLGDLSKNRISEVKVAFYNSSSRPLIITSCTSSNKYVSCLPENSKVDGYSNGKLTLLVEPQANLDSFSANILIKNNSSNPRQQLRVYGRYSDISTNLVEDNNKISISVSDSIDLNASAFVITSNFNNCKNETIDDNAIELVVSSNLLGIFNIVERSQIDLILEEAKFTFTGLVNDETAIEIGNLTGAHLAIIVSTHCFDGEPLQSLKLVNCSNGNQLVSASGVNMSFLDFIREFRNQIKDYI